MQGFVLTVHVIACVVLTVLVLLQSGKEGMGVIFGGGSGSVFGSSGAGGLLVKVTTAVAIIFLVTSLTYTKLTGISHVSSESVMTEGEIPEAKTEKEKPGVLFEDAQPAKEGGAAN